MDKEKQIEEMANFINEMDEPNANYYDENLEQHEAFANCFTIAKHLYEQGYRRLSESELNKKIQDFKLKSMELRIRQHYEKEFTELVNSVFDKQTLSPKTKQAILDDFMKGVE